MTGKFRESIPNDELQDNFDKHVEVLGGKLHDEWRSSRARDDGSYEPRPKQTLDEDWIAEHGTSEVDIANTPFSDLPNDWKEENRASAQVAMTCVYDASKQGVFLGSEDFIESAAERIHDAWVERNKSWAPASQKVLYEELGDAEKEKDRVIARKAVEVYSGLL